MSKNEFNDDLTLDPAKESLLQSFLNWGMQVTAKEGEGELTFKSMGVTVEPPNEIIESTLVNFILSSIDLENAELEEGVSKEELESELLEEASNKFPVPVDSLKETAHQTAQKLMEGDDLFKKVNFYAFRTKDDLMRWATDPQITAKEVYEQSE